jgi:hypothetical protein
MRTGAKLALAFLLVSSILLSAVPDNSSAIPYKIEGYLMDSEGLPIPLANMSVTGKVYDQTIPAYTNVTSYTETDANGYYKFWVGAMEPGSYNDGSKVTVAYNGPEGRICTDVTIGGLGAWANLTYEEQTGLIDVIMSPMGLVTLVAIVSAAFIVYYILSTSDKDRMPPGGEDAPKRVERRRRR